MYVRQGGAFYSIRLGNMDKTSATFSSIKWKQITGTPPLTTYQFLKCRTPGKILQQCS